MVSSGTVVPGSTMMVELSPISNSGASLFEFMAWVEPSLVFLEGVMAASNAAWSMASAVF